MSADKFFDPPAVQLLADRFVRGLSGLGGLFISGKRIMIWYSVSLGDGMVASIPSAEIEELFQRLFISAGKPDDMAVFTRSETEGRLHCNVIAYFSPAAADVAKAFDAQPCNRPVRKGLGLLAGDERSWSVLFPENTTP